MLSAHDWPGNIRELKTLVQRACLLFPGRKVGAREVNESLMRFSYPEPGQTDWPAAPLPDMVAQDAPNALGEVFRHGSGKIDLRGYLRDIEVVMISAALDAQSNCVSRAVPRCAWPAPHTRSEKMRKHGSGTFRPCPDMPDTGLRLDDIRPNSRRISGSDNISTEVCANSFAVEVQSCDTACSIAAKRDM